MSVKSMMDSLQTPMTRRPPKFQAVCSHLTDLAHRLGPGVKLPTVAQMRDQMGVSIATLNTALGELEAQRIIYRKHGVGIFVSERLNHKSICLICDPSFFQAAGTSPFWNMLIERSRLRAEAHNEDFSYHFALPRSGSGIGAEPRVSPLHEGLVREIKAGCVDGILGIGLSEGDADWLEAQRVPFVAFAGPGRYMVQLASQEMIEAGVENLAQQGCRRAALWSPVAPHRPGGPSTEPTEASRWFKESLERQGLPFEGGLVEENHHIFRPDGEPHAVTHQEQGFETASRVFGDRKIEPPDGILCTDDMMMVGALNAFRRLNIEPGKDVRIVTHGNVGSPVLMGWEEHLSVVANDPDEVVQNMFSLLETLMAGQTPTERVVRVHPRLLSR